MATLTLCMIVRDEEEFLGDCLASVVDAVDQIVVVDTGSVDRTVEIATAAGAVVLHEPWRHDFAHARNVALAAATGEWVLLLDADERLFDRTGSLREFIDRADVDCGLVQLHNASVLGARVEEVVSGTLRVGEPILLPRLLRRTGDLRWRGCVHEDVDQWLRDRGDRVKPVDVHLVHFGAIPDVRVLRRKGDRNIELLRRRLSEEPDNAGLWVHLGNELASRGEAAEALSSSERAWRLASDPGGGTWRAHAASAFTLRARLLWGRGELVSMLRTVDEAKVLFEAESGAPMHPNVYFLEGVVTESLAPFAEERRGRWQLLARAAHAYQALGRLQGGRWTAFVLPGILGSRGQVRLAGVLVQLGHFESAIMHLDKLDDAAELDCEAALVRAEALVGLGRADQALAVLDPLEGRHLGPDGPAIRARALLFLSQAEEAARAVAEADLRVAVPWTSGHRGKLLTHTRASLAGSSDAVFIGGAGRSGTTLFRAMLHAHPDFHCPPELKLFPELMDTVERWKIALAQPLAEAGIEAADLDAAAGSFIGRLLSGLAPRGSRVAEKTPHNAMHMEGLSNALPGARFIHVVRDGRAVVASLLRQPWINPTTGEPVEYCKTAQAAADYWAEVVQCARQDHAAILGSVLEVRYEDLVQHPEDTMSRVLAFLGAPWDPAVLNHRDGGAYLPPSESSSVTVSQPIHLRSVDKWRTELSDGEIRAVLDEVGYLLSDLGYGA